MKQIELTQGKFTLVDDEDYDYLMQWKWNYMDTGYAGRKIWVGRDADGTQHMKSVRMHRDLLNNPVGIQIDHIDHNRLNNQRANLRLATSSQNKMNITLRSDNTSGYKGVTWSEGGNCWKCMIWADGKPKHLGQFKDIEDAARAYDHAAVKYFGEFAVVNFPERLDEPVPKPRLQPRKNIIASSGYKGVRWHSGKWRVQICHHGKNYNVGRFTNIEDAAHAYDAKAVELFGLDAVLNFPNT